MKTALTEEEFHGSLLVSFIAVFIWSIIEPRNYGVWLAETLPVAVGVFIVVLMYMKFRLTTLAYLLIWIDAVIVLIGGHYTYSEVPLFEWLQNHFDLARNYYDRLGHFAQGVLPAILVREILLRKTPLKRGSSVFFLAIGTSLALSAAYELFEWIGAESAGKGAKDFLGTQGDIWDTQWDMFLALCGAVFGLLTLSKVHDNQIDKISDSDEARIS